MIALLANLYARPWGYSLFVFLRRLGGLGLFLLGVLDSSFLVMPFGNDLLLIAMVSSRHGHKAWIFYVIMASLGSVLGVLIIDLLMRKAGEEGLAKFVKPSQIEKIKSRMEKKAAWALITGALMPPPFPFTAVVLTAAALQYSRKKLLLAVLAGRVLRFTGEAMLALFYGRRLIGYMRSEMVNYIVYFVVFIAVVASIFSIYKWVSSRSAPSVRPSEAADSQG